MKAFEYLEPETIEEALRLLNRFGDEAKVLAGGTDLVVQLKQKSIQPKYVINIKKLITLKQIELTDPSQLRVGPLVTLSSIANSSSLPDGFRLVSQAGHAIGTPQVRNIATIGGNVCNASPSADLGPALIALRAQVKIQSLQGERVIPIEEFFRAPYRTCLESNELLMEIRIPTPPPHSAGTYTWLPKYTSVDETLVGCAVYIRLDPVSLRIEDAVVGLGAVGPTPMRAFEAETVLKKEKIGKPIFEVAGKKASEEAKPIARFGISSEYRRELVRVLVIRNLEELASEISKRVKDIAPAREGR